MSDKKRQSNLFTFFGQKPKQEKPESKQTSPVKKDILPQSQTKEQVDVPQTKEEARPTSKKEKSKGTKGSKKVTTKVAS